MKQDSFVNKQLPILFRVLIAGMFLLSAVAKLYPSPYFALTTFEVKQLVPMGFSESFAAYFSRILIGCEFALGFLLLQKHFFKRLIIPASFLLLLVFSIHLSYEIITTGNEGNCGCFGSLLPMTPVQALIKNIIGMAMLAFVFKKTPKDGNSNFYFILSVTLAAVLAIFMLGPISKQTTTTGEDVESVEDEPAIDDSDTIQVQTSDVQTTPQDKKIDEKKEDAPVVEVVDEPKAKKSGYASLYADIDKGRKILCFFAPGCEHCKETAKELAELSKTVPNFPEIKIAFMDEEAELIPDFFAYSGQKCTYKVLDVLSFWKTLGSDKDTPGVFYLWNGNLVKQYDGINAKAFKKDEFKKIVQKKWSELK